jgi:ABC-type dipeptide/oligopeptide/nickel transport system ATPase subunit
MKLKTLKLKAFRGATQAFSLNFDETKNVTLIYGENGSGKSTISDALTCLCTDSIGSIKDKTGTDSGDLLSMGSNANDLKIQLQTDTGVWNASFVSKKIVTSPSQGIPKLRAIRRQHIVDLANAAPAERYKHLKNYIDVDGVAQSEDKLRTLVKNLESQLLIQENTYSTAEQYLKEAWEKEGRPLGNWDDWVGEAALRDTGLETEHLQKIQITLDYWRHLQDATQNHVINQRNIKQAKEDYNTLITRQEALINETPEQESSLLVLLEKMQQHLLHTNNSVQNCPICQQSIEKSQLSIEIGQRIATMESLSEITHEVENAKKKQQIAEGMTEQSRAVFQQVFEVFKDSMLELAPNYGIGNALFPYSNLATAYQAQPWPEISKVVTQLGQQVAQLNIALGQHTFIKTYWNNLCKSYVQVKDLKDTLKAAKDALQIVENARKSFVEAELNAVSTDVDALYRRIHENEPLGGISLFLKEKMRGSVELTAQFHGKQVGPQAFYSESHLDTLAFCLLLALTKRYGDKTTILLLDDVLSACDEQHLDRFLLLLQEQSNHFAHTILTTHYRPWLKKYSSKNSESLHFVELTEWSIEKGIQIL